MLAGISKIGVVLALAWGFVLGPINNGWATSGGFSPEFEIDGSSVEHPTKFTLKDLQALPPTSEDVYFTTGKGPVSAKYTGVLLWDLLQKVGIKLDPAIKNDILRKLVVVVATDGYTVFTTLGELAPQFGGHQVLVAYEQDGKPLGPDSGFARLIFPNDKAGGRAISWIKSIRVH